MSSLRKPRLLPGLIAGLLPWGLLAASAALLVLSLGGVDGLSRTLGMAGRSIHLMAVLTVVGTVLLSLVLFFVARGRNVPLVVPAVLAMVPWQVGVRGALRGTQGVIDAAAAVSPEDWFPVLLRGTGELLCARMLGAWFAVALLLAAAGGLIVAGWALQDPEQAPTGEQPRDRILEACVVLLLAGLGTVAAFESRRLSEVLVAASAASLDDRATLLAAVAQELRALLWPRAVALVGLVLASLALVKRWWVRQPRATGALLSLALLALVVAVTLRADGQPLTRMGEALDQAARGPASP